MTEPASLVAPKPAESPLYKVGQVVRHEGYGRYMRICSIVYEGMTKKHHSYIVPAWNTKGTIQVHPDRIRPLTLEEFAGTSSPELPHSAQVTDGKEHYDHERC